MEEVFYDVERAIDFAFKEKKFVMNFYSYLKVKNARKIDAQNFKLSKVAYNIESLAEELELYIEGGQSDSAKQLREAYGHLSKPEARKIMNYILGFISDCDQFIKDKNAKKGKRRYK
jgi:hypothetical protein